MKIFIYSTYPFLLQLPFLSTQPTFNQSHLLLEKYTQAYWCRYYVFFFLFFFFEDAKSSLTKHKNVFWKGLMEPVKHLNWSILQKKLTAFSRKQFLQKILH